MTGKTSRCSIRPDPPPLTAHIINHTHWDREWFLTSVYTSRWIPGLIDRLAELAAQDPAFRFFLDGQTLLIEDLLGIAPHYREKVDRLVRDGHLLIGPYYCQPDWRLTSGEALVRNLLFGWQDMGRHGGDTDTGWLVDTFGHISQAPQLHALFGIHAGYIWRGAPSLAPYFNWLGADGTGVLAINLFGGYRNLYGVTHTPELALDRLLAELDKLAPFYPTPDIPLFDGYDLEDDPEDPVLFYKASQPEGVEVRQATPGSFAREIQGKDLPLPALSGELNSGKYAAIFPGTLSARTYLKRMARDCEYLLYQVCEPLAVLARQKGRPYPAESYEAWGRALLQNAVHDCICGVSTDQVHEKMEYTYGQVFAALQRDLAKSLDYILAGFAPGTYAVSTSPLPCGVWLPAAGVLYPVRTGGIGVWKAGDPSPAWETGRPVDSFTWKNAHYQAEVRPDGTVHVGRAVLGALHVYAERGDAYSGETGELLGVLRPGARILLEQASERHSVLRMSYTAALAGCEVTAVIRLTFDPSPLIRWQVTLDGSGTDYRVELIFETAQPGQVWAGMPFDIVPRPHADRDLLPRQLDERLAGVLLGQRELGVTRTFPFQDFVAISDGMSTSAVFAQGLHAYQAGENGRLSFTLRRAVSWLTRPDVESRVGDAGPAFYVPGAGEERAVTHDLAALLSDAALDARQLFALNAAFQNPPLLVETSGPGTETSLPFFRESLPLSSLHIANGRVLARLFNPKASPQPLARSYLETDVFGNPLRETDTAPAKGILTLSLGEPGAPLQEVERGRVRLLTPLAWHVGDDHGLPDPTVLREMGEKISGLEGSLAGLAAELSDAAPRQRYALQHRFYVLQRELLEYRLSLRLNEIKLGMEGQASEAYLFEPDEEIARIGRELNAARIKRRIYDYVVQTLGSSRA